MQRENGRCGGLEGWLGAGFGGAGGGKGGLTRGAGWRIGGGAVCLCRLCMVTGDCEYQAFRAGIGWQVTANYPAEISVQPAGNARPLAPPMGELARRSRD